MLVEIDTSKPFEIDWGAAGAAAIVQNVMVILNTRTYEVAYDRLLGMPGKFLDRPLTEAVALATAEVISAINAGEPRAQVQDVQYIGVDGNGALQFKVVIDI